MEKMWTLIKKFVKEEEGTELVEWTVMAALIVAGVVTVVALLGGVVSTTLQSLYNSLT